jgi:hypothetical protein
MRILLAYNDDDGTVTYTHEGHALLAGVPLDEGHLLAEEIGRLGEIPADRRRIMHQRANEAMAHTHSTDPAEALRYWARKDHGLDVEFNRNVDAVFLVDGGDG